MKLGLSVHRTTLERISVDESKYPAWHTYFNCQCYLNYIPAIEKATPSQDKLDDYRHLIDSSVCDLFVTEDQGILARWEELRPFKPVQSWDSFKAMLES